MASNGTVTFCSSLSERVIGESVWSGRKRLQHRILTVSSSKSLPVAAPDADPGFELGWDFAHCRLLPPAEHLLPGKPVRDGRGAGLSVFGRRTLQASPQVRKWLQLRLGAWMRGQSSEAWLAI
jgi:hypothetical protein